MMLMCVAPIIEVARSDRAQVALVNMPFSFSRVPVYSVGHPLGVVEVKGIAVDCHHLNVRFAHKNRHSPTNRFVRSERYSENGSSHLLFRDNPSVLSTRACSSRCLSRFRRKRAAGLFF